MGPLLISLVIGLYFALLLGVSYLTSRKSDFAAFFTANRQSPYYVVAFGMIGATLSGVTFISVPGEVGNSNFFYFQMVMGYIPGYLFIATVLLPLYYRLKLVSIYTYLKDRFGIISYKTGSAFFIVSKAIGAAFRLFLVANVLHIGIFSFYDIPFVVTVLVTLVLIWVYTFKSGIKTIVWTDSLQTLFMLVSVIISVYIIVNKLDIQTENIFSYIHQHEYSQIFNWDWQSDRNFFKQFFAGAFIAVVMTGLDQDMMQKNLTCRNIKESQKNMLWFSIALLPVNLLFMSLGVFLYDYAQTLNIHMPESSDGLFPLLALKYFGLGAGIIFLLGIIAAAFSSADSALTALTTAFCIDFLGVDIHKNKPKQRRTKRSVHIAFSVLLLFIIVIFRVINDESVVNAIFRVAGYTYGPLLGLFAFGLISKKMVRDKYVWISAIASPLLTIFIDIYSEQLLFGYKFGFEVIILNGLLMFSGLLFLSKKKK